MANLTFFLWLSNYLLYLNLLPLPWCRITKKCRSASTRANLYVPVPSWPTRFCHSVVHLWQGTIQHLNSRYAYEGYLLLVLVTKYNSDHQHAWHVNLYAPSPVMARMRLDSNYITAQHICGKVFMILKSKGHFLFASKSRIGACTMTTVLATECKSMNHTLQSTRSTFE